MSKTRIRIAGEEFDVDGQDGNMLHISNGKRKTSVMVAGDVLGVATNVYQDEMFRQHLRDIDRLLLYGHRPRATTPDEAEALRTLLRPHAPLFGDRILPSLGNIPKLVFAAASGAVACAQLGPDALVGLVLGGLLAALGYVRKGKPEEQDL